MIRIHHVLPPSTFAHSTRRQTTRRSAFWYSPCVHGVFVRMRWLAYERVNSSLNVSPDEIPYITFEERKNGPGEVSLLYGKKVLEDRFAIFADYEDWDGYLFPSPHASGGPISRWTVWNRFTQLAERAGLPDEIGGVSPSPKMDDASGMTPIPRHSTLSSEALTRLRPSKGARVPTSYCKITSQIRGLGSFVENICGTS